MSGRATRGQELAKAASNFIGVRFQIGSKDPAVGLDCVGLITCSLDAIGCRTVPPTGYSLRNSDHSGWIQCAEASGLHVVQGEIEVGDILLYTPGPGQQHLVIVEDTTSIIHAHAGLRKVVRQTLDQESQAQAHWRLP